MFSRTSRKVTTKTSATVFPAMSALSGNHYPFMGNVKGSKSIVSRHGDEMNVRPFSTDLEERNKLADENIAGIFDISISNSRFGFPLLGDGIQYDANLFGLSWSVDDTLEIMEGVFSRQNFLPRVPAQMLTGRLADMSDIASRMAIDMDRSISLDGEYKQTLDVDEPGLLARNQLRKTVRETLDNSHFAETMTTLEEFQQASGSEKQALGRRISDIAFWSQWLIRGILFEGKQFGEEFTEAVIRAPLSKIARASNLALGRHQMEFVYDDYTLKAAQFPERGIETVDYGENRSILQYIAEIDTPVGFNDIGGGRPEHNFRHNHSLMEAQMTEAFLGFEQLMDGDQDGWKPIVESAFRSHRVFNSMLSRTTAKSYPMVRLPIKGTRGACGSVYPETGVIYEGCGVDVFHVNGEKIIGMNKTAEFGQTGANSSMYKWFDTLTGTAHYRHAYELDESQKEVMAGVIKGTVDPGKLVANNPIESMQFAFDLLTRPAIHLEMLVETKHRITESRMFENASLESQFQRLATTYWVAMHRLRHGQYVLKAIYNTNPVGGQSRAQGTGGSTPPFLKMFLDQTIIPGLEVVKEMKTRGSELSQEQKDMLEKVEKDFASFDRQMAMIKQRGEDLEDEERLVA